jgi:iron complex outermembrane receptor protein
MNYEKKSVLFRAKFLTFSIVSLCLSLPALSGANNDQANLDDYFNLSLEDLLSLEVTSVSKKKQNLNEVASAIFVITQEDIRRSGVTSIPEALRLAPGIQVARMDTNKWAITSRGFNHQFANKLLVMIDGRSVYTPSFSGVYWDVQDTMLEDIDRIEVIRGAGATIWGANAMNGVINIITKSAAETRGVLISGGAGNEEKGFISLRVGRALSDHTDARGFIKFNERDSSWLTRRNGQGEDSLSSVRSGFRVDSTLSQADKWTLQGDIYEVDNTQTADQWVDPYDPANAADAPDFRQLAIKDTVKSQGWNLLTRWDHQSSAASNTSLQVYFDHAEHDEALLGMNIDTFDVDFRHQFAFSDNQEFIWGLGYRLIDSEYENTFGVEITPPSQSVSMSNIFLQDEIALAENIKLTIGSKLEKHENTGTDLQPSLRLSWALDETSVFWSSISRAVRTPSAVEYGSRTVANVVPAMPPFLPFPVVQYSIGSDELVPEKLIAYEMGYRFQPQPNLSLDATIFITTMMTLKPYTWFQHRSFQTSLTAMAWLPPASGSNSLLTGELKNGGKSRVTTARSISLSPRKIRMT